MHGGEHASLALRPTDLVHVRHKGQLHQLKALTLHPLRGGGGGTTAG